MLIDDPASMRPVEGVQSTTDRDPFTASTLDIRRPARHMAEYRRLSLPAIHIAQSQGDGAEQAGLENIAVETVRIACSMADEARGELATKVPENRPRVARRGRA